MFIKVDDGVFIKILKLLEDEIDRLEEAKRELAKVIEKSEKNLLPTPPEAPNE